MKKQIIFAIGLLASFALTGCTTTEPMVAPNNQAAAQPSMVQPVSSSDAVVSEATQGAAVESDAADKQVTIVESYEDPYENMASKLIKITGIGYGAESTFEGYTQGQRRLMAIRSAKLDAYRSLAEQLYGIKIDSNTSVATLTAKNDSFRARVNAIVRGARVVSITPMADKNYETILEVYVDQSFFHNAFIYSAKPNMAKSRTVSLEELCADGSNCESYGSKVEKRYQR